MATSHFDFLALTRADCSAKPSALSRRRIALAMLALTSVVIAGCGQGPSSSRSTEGQAVERIASLSPAAAAEMKSERYETALERRGGKLRVTPVPASYQPKISKAEAMESFKARRVFPQTAAGERADVQLGLYTSDEMNYTWPPFYHDQPAWVIRYDHVPGEANPDPLASTRIGPPLKPSHVRVDILVFIDAETGLYLNAVQDPVAAD